MPRPYTAHNWYWLVSSNPSQVYHSAAQMYVALDHSAYVAFLSQGNAPTSISTEDELRQVLDQANAPSFEREQRPSRSVPQRVSAIEHYLGIIEG